MNEIQIFKSNDFGDMQWYEKDGTVYLNLEACARGLGFTQIAGSGNEVVRWERVRKYLSSFGIPTSGDDIPDFIPENLFYRLAMKAKNDKAERFQSWIADDVIPSIRKTGSYTTAMSPAELILAQAQQLVEQEKRLKEIELQQIAVADKVDSLETLVESKLDPTVGMDWYTITGYASLKKYRINPNDYSKLGKKASELSRMKGYEIGNAPHPVYGRVGVYNTDILQEVFRLYDGKW